MTASTELPAHFLPVWSLDLRRSVRTLLFLNLAALPLFFLSGWFFFTIIRRIRPEIDLFNFLSAGTGWLLLSLLGSYIMVIILHEICHGVAFYIITGSKPEFRFHWAYAYTAAPDFFIRRNPYLAIGLAPLVLMSAAGLLLTTLVAENLVFLIWVALSANAAGAIGDLYVTARLVIRHLPEAVVQDEGYKFTVFQPVPALQQE